jgi:misacylated tRNA(Ala) deacylase
MDNDAQRGQNRPQSSTRGSGRERDMIPEPTIRLFEADAYLTEAEGRIVSVSDEGIRLDRTLFYAESGGQPGDSGSLTPDDGEAIEIADVNYAPGRITIVHKPKSAQRSLLPGQPVRMKIDWQRRYPHMRMHTCLHILCSLVDAPITGCAIHADHARLDFDLEENTLDKAELTERMNDIIKQDIQVEVLHWPISEVRARPALVRTAFVAPPEIGDTMRIVQILGVDIQPCGGTHVRSTGEIGSVFVRKIEKKSRRNRRVTVAFAG